MKYIYMVEINGDFASASDYNLEYELNNKYWKIFKTRVEATKYMTKIKSEIKKDYLGILKEESKRGNTFSVDVQRYEIDDDRDFFNDKAVYLSDLWEYSHVLIEARYLCGRY